MEVQFYKRWYWQFKVKPFKDISHQSAVWASLSAIKLDFWRSKRRNYDFFYNRKTLPKGFLFSQEQNLTMIWSIQENIFTQSIKVERKSSLGDFLPCGRVYLLNNYCDEFKLHSVFLYCATVFSWNKCCSVVLKLPDFLAVTAKYWKHPVEKIFRHCRNEWLTWNCSHLQGKA